MTDRDDLARKGAENQVEGAADELKGKVKNTIGAMKGDTSEQIAGKAQELKGKIQRNFGEGQSDASR